MALRQQNKVLLSIVSLALALASLSVFVAIAAASSPGVTPQSGLSTGQPLQTERPRATGRGKAAAGSSVTGGENRNTQGVEAGEDQNSKTTPAAVAQEKEASGRHLAVTGDTNSGTAKVDADSGVRASASRGGSQPGDPAVVEQKSKGHGGLEGQRSGSRRLAGHKKKPRHTKMGSNRRAARKGHAHRHLAAAANGWHADAASTTATPSRRSVRKEGHNLGSGAESKPGKEGRKEGHRMEKPAKVRGADGEKASAGPLRAAYKPSGAARTDSRPDSNSAQAPKRGQETTERQVAAAGEPRKEHTVEHKRPKGKEEEKAADAVEEGRADRAEAISRGHTNGDSGAHKEATPKEIVSPRSQVVVRGRVESRSSGATHMDAKHRHGTESKGGHARDKGKEKKGGGEKTGGRKAEAASDAEDASKPRAAATEEPKDKKHRKGARGQQDNNAIGAEAGAPPRVGAKGRGHAAPKGQQRPGKGDKKKKAAVGHAATLHAGGMPAEEAASEGRSARSGEAAGTSRANTEARSESSGPAAGGNTPAAAAAYASVPEQQAAPSAGIGRAGVPTTTDSPMGVVRPSDQPDSGTDFSDYSPDGSGGGAGGQQEGSQYPDNNPGGGTGGAGGQQEGSQYSDNNPSDSSTSQPAGNFLPGQTQNGRPASTLVFLQDALNGLTSNLNNNRQTRSTPSGENSYSQGENAGESQGPGAYSTTEGGEDNGSNPGNSQDPSSAAGNEGGQMTSDPGGDMDEGGS